jgi:hypothetical protein
VKPAKMKRVKLVAKGPLPWIHISDKLFIDVGQSCHLKISLKKPHIILAIGQSKKI